MHCLTKEIEGSEREVVADVEGNLILLLNLRIVCKVISLVSLF